MCQLSILRLYYTGQLTLDQLSFAHECDARAVIDAHEALPADERAAIDAKWKTLKMTDCGLAQPDDPMFSGGVEFFTTRRKRNADLEIADMEQFGREARAGFKAQSEGGYLSGADIDAMRDDQ